MDGTTIATGAAGSGAILAGLWRAAKSIWDMGSSAAKLATAVEANTTATNQLSAKVDTVTAAIAAHETRLSVLEQQTTSSTGPSR
jgi:predicted component of type VI protein secretion system